MNEWMKYIFAIWNRFVIFVRPIYLVTYFRNNIVIVVGIIVISSAGWAYKTVGQNLSVCVCVNQGYTNHNRCT